MPLSAYRFSRVRINRTRRSSSLSIYRNSTAILSWLVWTGLLLGSAPANAGDPLPNGGSYVAGNGTITNSTNTTTISQSTTYGIINWQGFSIANGNAVQFNNGSGATLNRVTGTAASNIDGQLSATGSVYLINPQGVVVGPNGKVVTNGSFVASTRDVSDGEFMSGGKMTAKGTSNGDVVNAGVITSNNGDVILVGRNVSNKGTVSAANGTAGLVAGNEIVLQPVGSDSRIAVSGGSGNATNEGTVTAAQARLMSAGGNVYALAGNNGGVVSATGTASVDGHVWLTAEEGNVAVSGTVSATNTDGSGGTVTVSGTDLNASGTINASAASTGKKGGKVDFIGTKSATVSGTITAAGGGTGLGGFIETSGTILNIGGAKINGGDGGQWLLDPDNLTVDATAASTINSSLGGGTSVTLKTTSTTASGPGTTSAGNGDIIINSAISWSTGATLTLNSYNNINFNDNVTVAGSGTLTMSMTNGDYSFAGGKSISFTGSGGKLNINGNSYKLLYSMSDLQAVDNDHALLGSVKGRYALATSLDATSVSHWDAIGSDITLLGGFTGTFTGLGHTISNLNISSSSSNFGLFGYVSGSGMVRDIGMVGGSVSGGSNTGALVGNNHGGTILNAYATGTVSGSSDVGGLVGDNVSGTIKNAYATGAVTGSNHVGGLVGASDNGSANIINSYATGAVTSSGDYAGGLVGSASGTVSGSYATGTVSGSDSVGGLAGYTSGTVSNAYATGRVTGTGHVGGLVGYATGDINSSYATGTVTGSNNYVGGLVGYTTGDIDASHATGTVSTSSSYSYVGGLVGYASTSTVSSSYATGDVSGSDDIGGLIGYQNAGLTTTSYATGSVTGVKYNIGGLIGIVSTVGTVAYSYATGNVSGGGYVGGLVGSNAASTVHDSYAMGAVRAGFGGSVSTKQYVGGLVGYNSAGAISNSFSTGVVIAASGYSDVGGLVGDNNTLGSVSNSYWDTQTSGWTTSDGGTGRTTAQLQGTLPSGFSSSNWSTGTNLYPYLNWQGAQQAVSGITYSDAGSTVLPSNASGLVAVSALINGASAGSATAGANGYYYIMMPASRLSSAGQLITYIANNAVNANTYVQNASGRVNNVDLYGGYLRILSGATATSSMFSGLATAVGGNSNSDLLYVGGSLVANTSMDIESSSGSGFNIDSNINLGTGTMIIGANGLVTETTGSIVVRYLELLGSGASYQLTGSANDIDTIAANTGDVSETDKNAITIGAVNGVSGITSSGAVTVVAKGNLTIASGAKVQAGSNKAVVLAATGNFVNNRGSDAVQVSGTGRWLIYSSSPTGDVFGNLNSGNTPVWNAVYGSAIAQGGNRYVFANQPTLTITTSNVSKVYGDNATGAVAAAYTVSGYQSGVAGAYLADTAASVYSGAPTVTSSGSAATAGVGTYGITATITGMTLLNGYAVGFNNTGVLTVGARGITVKANDQSRAYGNANPTLTYVVGGSGLVNGDTLTGSLTTTATTTSNVGSYDITQGTLAASTNYSITSFTKGTLTVVARDITVKANDQSRAYGNANPTLTYVVGGAGLVNGDTLTGSLTTTATTASNVGTYDITQGTLTTSTNYNITTFTPGTLTVVARDITVKANDQSRAYGNANPALTYTVGGSGLVNGDTLIGSLTTTATTASNVGTYAVTQGTLAASTNYSITTFTPGTLTVVARDITVKADDQSRVYGNANPALTYVVGGSGLVNGDTLTGSLTTLATMTSSVGPYAITQGTLSASSNYKIAYTPGTLTVVARDITVKADDQSRVYGNANPALTYTVGGLGLVNGDTLTGGLATTATTTSSVGPYAITQGTLAASSNYNITTFTPGTLTVVARDITVKANDQSRAYGNANPALTYVVGGLGLVNGDALTGSLTTTATTTSSVGNYAITQGTLAASTNYNITTFTPGTMTVIARDITVKANDQSRAYGNANPALTYVVGGLGLVNEDTLTGGLTTTATTTSSVGPYAITQGTLAASTNYNITFTPGTLTVVARDISVKADDQSRIYGNANPALTYTVGGLGLVNGDTLTGNLATVAGLTSNVGAYAITQGTLAASGNYTITSFTPGTLTIGARDITVTADDQSRAYGNANPTLTYVVGGLGLVNGDTLTGGLATTATAASNVGTYAITQGTLAASSNYDITLFSPGTLTVVPRRIAVRANDLSRAYGNANPALTYTVGGLGLVNGDTLTGSLTTTATTTSSVGNYAITQDTLAASANYDITTFTPGTLTVVARDVTVTADDQSRIYGNANPALTYTVGGAGLVNGDTLTGSLATVAGLTSNVGTYAITQGTLAASGNYRITTFTPATLTVVARDITVKADDQSRVYGNANPALTYTVGGLGLVNGDTLTGSLATVAGLTSNVGAYAITQGTLAASGNYTITSFTPGTLTVAARTITVTADPQSRTYGNANPALTYVIGGLGLVNGDTLSGGLTTVAATTSSVGPYAITQGTLAASNNYSLTYVGNSLTVTPATLTITANDVQALSLSRAVFSANYSGFVNGDNSSVVSGLSFGVQPVTGNPLEYGINPYGATASNYTINYVSGVLTVSQPDNPVNNDTTTLIGTLGAFRTSNLVTAAIGGGVRYLLYQYGIPGQISPFEAVGIGDYSNAVDDDNRLVSDP